MKFGDEYIYHGRPYIVSRIVGQWSNGIQSGLIVNLQLPDSPIMPPHLVTNGSIVRHVRIPKPAKVRQPITTRLEYLRCVAKNPDLRCEEYLRKAVS